MKRLYQIPQIDIEAMDSYPILQEATSPTRQTYGGTKDPEDGGIIIPSGVIDTDGSEDPFGNSQGKGTRANEGLWED